MTPPQPITFAANMERENLHRYQGIMELDLRGFLNSLALVLIASNKTRSRVLARSFNLVLLSG